MCRLVDCEGNVVLTMQGNLVLNADADTLAVVHGRSVRTLDETELGSVTSHGRFFDDRPREVVIVLDELRDTMGALLGRFEDASPVERGLLALVYGPLVIGR